MTVFSSPHLLLTFLLSITMSQLVLLSSPVPSGTECICLSLMPGDKAAAYFNITVQYWQDMLLSDNGIS